MNYINLPKDIKDIIISFLFDEDQHNINKYSCLRQIHCMAHKACWNPYREKRIIVFLYKRSNSKFKILDELNQRYMDLYEDKSEYYERQQRLGNMKCLKDKRERVKINKINKKLRRNERKKK